MMTNPQRPNAERVSLAPFPGKGVTNFRLGTTRSHMSTITLGYWPSSFPPRCPKPAIYQGRYASNHLHKLVYKQIGRPLLNGFSINSASSTGTERRKVAFPSAFLSSLSLELLNNPSFPPALISLAYPPATADRVQRRSLHRRGKGTTTEGVLASTRRGKYNIHYFSLYLPVMSGAKAENG